MVGLAVAGFAVVGPAAGVGVAMAVVVDAVDMAAGVEVFPPHLGASFANFGSRVDPLKTPAQPACGLWHSHAASFFLPLPRGAKFLSGIPIREISSDKYRKKSPELGPHAFSTAERVCRFLDREAFSRAWQKEFGWLFPSQAP